NSRREITKGVPPADPIGNDADLPVYGLLISEEHAGFRPHPTSPARHNAIWSACKPRTVVAGFYLFAENPIHQPKRIGVASMSDWSVQDAAGGCGQSFAVVVREFPFDVGLEKHVRPYRPVGESHVRAELNVSAGTENHTRTDDLNPV